ncbi:MAG: NAD(P)-binding domain-containing protein [Candidatus Sericytochromatia bacterium]|uniref:NAD(P)-binding domain-containing protein n=1 Tax=Candidatus Tanganyikabacteria bacterium TaxID=2961651 RepID=A0A937X4Z7_9BACT|nr:NAD(P)-binding domain-containing protein [Candidatus Tanganyikabacteria bacterium]
MKVGILGSGNVARALGAGFLKHGHLVMLGSRSPEKLAEWAAAQGGARTGTFGETADFAEVVVLAVVGRSAAEALDLAGADRLAGKVVVDTTNPIAEGGPENGILRYFTGANESLMERLQARFPDARFVKAFNSIGSPFMVNPTFPGGAPVMFYCGNDAEAKAFVAGILVQFGFEPEDVGGVEAARPIEALCQLWCARGFQTDQWAHAIHLLKAEARDRVAETV